MIGESVCFEAAVTGRPTPQVEWNCNGLSIDEDYQENVDRNKYRITMPPTTIRDRGTYTLTITAQNDDGRDTKDIILTVRGNYGYMLLVSLSYLLLTVAPPPTYTGFDL